MGKKYEGEKENGYGITGFPLSFLWFTDYAVSARILIS